MLRRTVCASALLVCCALVARAEDPPTTVATTTSSTLPSAQEVLDRYLAVTGGSEAHAAVRTRHASGVYAMPDLGVEGTFDYIARADGPALLVIDLPGIGTIRQGISARGVVWTVDPSDGPRILTRQDAAGLRRSLAIGADLSLARYVNAEVVGLATLNGRPAYRLDLVDRTGLREQRFFDVESGLLVRSVATTTLPTSTQPTTNPDLGPLTVTTFYSDYSDVPPIRLPTRIRQSAFGLSPEMITRHVEHNVDLPDARFDPPPEVMALRRGSTSRPTSRPATRGSARTGA